MRIPSRSAVSVVLLAALFTSGCFGWGTQPTPTLSSTQRLPDPVRVTRLDTSTLILRDAAVSGDSIVGHSGDQRVAVALADVQKVEGQEVDFLKTAGTSFMVTLVIVGVTAAVVLASLLSAGG
jgi:hypothetical protein